jgi:hypothetical protein
MAAFRPLIPPEPLPAIGTAIEHATLDAKAKVDLTKPFHLAKDVASFANHLGGNLLVGVPENRGVLQAPVPMTRPEAAAVQNAFSKEVTSRCHPKPLIDFGLYIVGTGVVLTVVVFPYVGQAVGIKVAADSSKGGYGGDAYAFPLRVGADSSYLTPEQLSMLMLPEYRRIVIALSALNRGDRVHMHLEAAALGSPGGATWGYALFESADALTNTLILESDRGAQGGFPKGFSVPIDHVKTVWKAPDGWRIALRGSYTSSGFVPSAG